jgi:hypothetical protein
MLVHTDPIPVVSLDWIKYDKQPAVFPLLLVDDALIFEW